MRRLALILLASAVLAPAALAAHRAAGDGTLAGSNINGTVKIGARGAIWGQIDNGSIVVNDPDPTDGPPPKVSGDKTPVLLQSGAILYVGRNLHFQIAGGRYTLSIQGAGIDFSAVGSGRAILDALDSASSPGKYAVGDDAWQPVPYTPATVVFPATSTP